MHGNSNIKYKIEVVYLNNSVFHRNCGLTTQAVYYTPGRQLMGY